jgi:hypothetical protein
MGVKASFTYNTVMTMEQQTLEQIYDSYQAKAYRQVCTDCNDYRLRPACGGCLVIAYWWDFDPLRIKDPACFL